MKVGVIERKWLAIALGLTLIICGATRAHAADDNRTPCGLFHRIGDNDGSHLLVSFGGGTHAVVDLEQQRVLRTVPQPLSATNGWAVILGKFILMRPEGGAMTRIAATRIWIIDFETGRELACVEAPPGQLKAVGNRLLVRPYGTSDILVYEIDEAVLRRNVEHNALCR